MGLFDDFFQRFSGEKEEEIPEFLKIIPQDKRDEVLQKFENLRDPARLADVNQSFKDIEFLHRAYENVLDPRPADGINNAEKAFAPISIGLTSLGYDAAGSVLRRLYPHPFMMFAFIGDNYGPAWKAVAAVVEEVSRDGWVLIANDGVSKKQVKAAYQLMKDYDIDNLRLTLVRDLRVFGNAFVLRDSNVLGGTTGLTHLLPERILPAWDRDEDKILGWLYLSGDKKIALPMKKVDHLMTYSNRSNVMGTPALASVVTQIEADLHAGVYNNTLMQKGGLLQALVSLDKIESTLINDKAYLQLAQAMQKYFDKRFSGIRSGGSLAFSPNIKNVYQLNKIAEMDGAYKTLSEKAEHATCSALGVPPERIGLSRTSQYQNNSLIDDSVTLSFDNSLYFLLKIVDKYINDVVLPQHLGITNIKLHAKGEFSSISKTAAEFAKYVSEIGAPSMSVDEFRVRVLHWEPIGGTLGRTLLGTVIQSKDAMGNPVLTDGILAPDSLNSQIEPMLKAYRHNPKDIELY